jgi:FkbM family methyltransferase
VNLLADWYWPAGDLGTGGTFKHESMAQQWVDAQCELAIRHASLVPRDRRHTVVQAGGNVGIMPAVYSGFFDAVVTFEPDPANWECLLPNLERHGQPNVIRAVPAALGNIAGVAPIRHNIENCGASYLDPRPNPDMRDPTMKMCQVVTLDSFGLMACDLLQLDCEGFEIFAIQGAIDTIMKHRPVIVVEINECVRRYDSSPEALRAELHNLGYSERPLLQQGNDHVFKHKSEST